MKDGNWLKRSFNWAQSDRAEVCYIAYRHGYYKDTAVHCSTMMAAKSCAKELKEDNALVPVSIDTVRKTYITYGEPK